LTEIILQYLFRWKCTYIFNNSVSRGYKTRSSPLQIPTD